MLRNNCAAWAGSAALLLPLCATAANAQVASLSSSAAPPYVLAESLSVLARLENETRATPTDASAWHRLGKLAWSVRNHLRETVSSGDKRVAAVSKVADSALHRALALNANSAEIHLDVGRLLLESGVSLTRAASYGHFEGALELARGGADNQTHARAAIEVGRVHWRRFDSYANRWMAVGHACINLIDRVANGGPRSVELRPADGVAAIRTLLSSCAQPTSTPSEQSGEADYIQAERLFREAMQSDPSSTRAFTQMGMLLTERGRWVELAALGREHIEFASHAGLAWLAVGLAEQRQGRTARATAAFDTALTLLPVYERQRIDRLERVLSPIDARRVATFSPASTDWFTTLYWKAAIPLWSNDNVIPRTEFLARVTEAELRWTVDELNVRGADTDRGDVFVRYGPPDLAFSIRPTGSSQVYTVWGYDFAFVFKFVGQPTFATAQIPPQGQEAVGNRISTMPVRWSGLENLRLDSLPIQVARFRGAADSLEVLIAVAPPSSEMRRVSELQSDVRADVWLALNGNALLAHDSVMKADDRVHTVVRTVPFGTYLVRAEASLSGAGVASRATAVLIGRGADPMVSAPFRGFAMSDVLVAAPSEDTSALKRWRDVDVKPLVGTVPRRGQVALIWETYGLAERDGTARYSVAVTLKRQRSGVGRVAAAIVRGAARVVGTTSSNNQIALKYDRIAASADVLVENITLALQDTPTGAYTISVAVTDAITGAVAMRTVSVTIADK